MLNSLEVAPTIPKRLTMTIPLRVYLYENVLDASQTPSSQNFTRWVFADASDNMNLATTNGFDFLTLFEFTRHFLSSLSWKACGV
jgi:hypothetical protein